MACDKLLGVGVLASVALDGIIPDQTSLTCQLRPAGEESGCETKSQGAEFPHLLCAASWGVRWRERSVRRLPYCTGFRLPSLLRAHFISDKLQLKSPESFYYLSQSGCVSDPTIDDVRDFNSVKVSFSAAPDDGCC